MPEAHRSTYPPLDTLKPVTDGVWIVDSGPLRRMGLSIPIRMTVIRLAGGDLLLHSPTEYTDSLHREMEAIGRVQHLVAPNVAHWSFLQEWQRQIPEAATWAAPGLRERNQVKKSGVRLDHDLSNRAPTDWAGEIDHVVVPGGAGFREVALFHRSSRTLVLTDLVVNMEAEKLPWAARPGARLAGVLAPHGKAPVYLRLVIDMKHSEAAKAAWDLIERNPARVIFSHGRWFDQEATLRLRKSLRWLLP
jgi:hypothetical protein